MLLNENDRFGYYFANGVKSYSKYECMQVGRPTFHFNDEVYGAMDTTFEPLGSLWDMYKARVRQIRRKYDYVVLMYSGGSDSSNILDAFLEAGCDIDELACCWDRPTTGLSHSFHNAEITEVVIPTLKRLQNIKSRLIDITELGIKAVEKLGLNFEYYSNYHMSVNTPAKWFLREYVKDWRDMIDAGKRLVIVWGLEKPTLAYHSNKHWLYFQDRIDNAVGPYCIGKPGWFDELFYWTPDMPELVIKQAHTVARFCRTVHIPEFYQNERTDNGYNPVLNKYLTYDALKQVLYPKWNPATFCNGKAGSFIYSVRDTFFLKGNVNSDRYRQIVDSYLKDIPVKERQSVYPMVTREYEIG